MRDYVKGKGWVGMKDGKQVDPTTGEPRVTAMKAKRCPTCYDVAAVRGENQSNCPDVWHNPKEKVNIVDKSVAGNDERTRFLTPEAKRV